MRVFILTLGTRGDLELFLGLGMMLQQRGHEVVLGCSSFFGPTVAARGLSWVPIGSGTRAELLEVLQGLGEVADRTHRIRAFFQRWLQPQLSVGAPQLNVAVATADYCVSNLLLAWRRAGQPIPGSLVIYDPPVEEKQLFAQVQRLRQPALLPLVALPRRLLDPEECWGPEFHFTGFWLPEAQSAWQPTTGLRDFVASQPPVVMTLGSMATAQVASFVETFATALARCGQTGLVVGGWSALPAMNPWSERVWLEAEVDYRWLFPRSACVIHHGGTGTVAAVLQAGKPSIVLPQLACQERFADLLLREQLATGNFAIETLTAEVLADAIQRALVERTILDQCSRWQKQISAAAGLARAADLIEGHGKSLVIRH